MTETNTPAEPFAWVVLSEQGNTVLWTQNQTGAKDVAEKYGCEVTPLYASPQPAARQPSKQRNREEDRARFSDPQFNRWLDEAITENGEFTVWDQIGDVCDAWHGWENRQFYAAQQPVAVPDERHFIEFHQMLADVETELQQLEEQAQNTGAPAAPHQALQDALFCYASGPDGAAALLIRGWSALVSKVVDEVAGDDWEGALCDLNDWSLDGAGNPFSYSTSFEDGFMTIYRIAESAAAPQAPSREPLTSKPQPKCVVCNGRGTVEQFTSAAAPKTTVKCPFCAGDGKCRTEELCGPHGCHGGCLPTDDDNGITKEGSKA